jgi:hypothetical protein
VASWLLAMLSLREHVWQQQKLEINQYGLFLTCILQLLHKSKNVLPIKVFLNLILLLDLHLRIPHGWKSLIIGVMEQELGLSGDEFTYDKFSFGLKFQIRYFDCN